jgi:hypothetical protein
VKTARIDATIDKFVVDNPSARSWQVYADHFGLRE